MTREEAVALLKKYGRVRLQQEFMDIRIETHQRMLKYAENNHRRDIQRHRLEQLEQVHRANRDFMAEVDGCLSLLDRRQKEVLWHFYIERTYDYIEILNEKLNVERSQIYRIKDRAITAFAALYTKDFY